MQAGTALGPEPARPTWSPRGHRALLLFPLTFQHKKKLTRHSVGLCHLRCQPISKTFSVLKISCFYSAFWVTCGTEGECAPAQRVPTAHHHPHLRRPRRGPHSEPWLSSCRAAGDMGSQAGGASVSSHHPGLHAALTSLPSSLGGGVRQHTWLWCLVAKPRPLGEKHLCRESDPVLTSGPCDRRGQTGTPRRPFSCRGEHGGAVSIYP